MPTREEQVAQIEASLRHRFFPIVPKVVTPERVTWKEENHDTDRLSRALAAYALVGLCEVDDLTAAGAVTDGKDDGGIDALYFDRPRNRLVIVQSKFKRSGTAPAQDEMLKTINGIKALLQRRFDSFNECFRTRRDEIEIALDTPGVFLEVVLVFLGETLGQHVIDDLDALKTELNTPFHECLVWSSHGASHVHSWLVSDQTPAAATADVILENWSCVDTPRKAVYGQVTAATLARLVELHGKALFERNIRHYLGSVGVNTAIAETVRLRPGDFFYLNNGLTAVAETITNSPGNPRRCNFRVTNFSIVNGAQTAGTIATAASEGAISPDAKVLMTIIEIGSNPDDIGPRITKARNYQNVVRGADYAALDPNQERLRQELAIWGITYHYRPSAEARVRREDACTLEDGAVALACLGFQVRTSPELHQLRIQGRKCENAIDFAIAAKKEIGRLWDQDGPIYKALFAPALSGVRLFRLVRIYRLIDQILADTERSERATHRRMFFRHGRYFIMAFVAHQSADVLDRKDIQLSEQDKTLLSQRVNQLSVLIHAEAARLPTDKGYLAIFRNLTDSQPFADSVIQRLTAPPPTPAAPVAVAAAPPPPPVTPNPEAGHAS